MSWLTYLLVFGLKTLISKNAIWPPCQKSFAQISKGNSFPVRVDNWRVSPVVVIEAQHRYIGTFFNSVAVIFRIWLWRMEIKQPFLHHLHEGACYISKLAPHSQLLGNIRRAHAYLIRIKSQNNCFVNSAFHVNW